MTPDELKSLRPGEVVIFTHPDEKSLKRSLKSNQVDMSLTF